MDEEDAIDAGGGIIVGESFCTEGSMGLSVADSVDRGVGGTFGRN
jgi:hypothetical protein